MPLGWLILLNVLANDRPLTSSASLAGPSLLGNTHVRWVGARSSMTGCIPLLFTPHLLSFTRRLPPFLEKEMEEMGKGVGYWDAPSPPLS